MNIDCEIVRDLLPLYVDGVCSEGSRNAVAAHLEACEKCREFCNNASRFQEDVILKDIPAEKETIHGFRKVRRRWTASLMAVVLLIPILLMSVNQIRGMGICYSNIDDYLTARRFTHYLASGKFDMAAQMYDFTQDYRVINEILSASPELYQPTFHACKIGDEIWYIRDSLAEKIDFTYDADRVWKQLLYNGHNGILIPRTKMEDLLEHNDGFVTTELDGYTINDGQTFYPVETPWGLFFAERSDIDSFVQSEKQDVDYAVHFSVMPEKMYQDILPALKSDAQMQYDANIALYAGVSDMTEAEFCAYMQKKYETELEAVFSHGISLTEGHYNRSYYVSSSGYRDSSTPEDGWAICFRCDTAKEEERYPISLDIHVRDGKVTGLAMAYTNSAQWCEELIDALFPGYGT